MNNISLGYKQTEVGVIPEDWKVEIIGELASVGAGGTPSRKIPAYWNGPIPWITTSQIDFGMIAEADQFITEDGLKNSATKLLPAGTLLLALYGQGKTRGKVGMLGFEAATNQACASISIRGDVSREFLLHFLISRYEVIRNSSNSGSQENLNGQLVKNIQVALPPTKAEQEAIAEALSDTDALIKSLEQLIAKKRHLKQGSMQELLTGKKRLPGFSGEWEVKRLGDIAHIKTGNLNNEDKVDDGAYPFFVRSQYIEKINTYSHECEAILVPGEGNIGNIFHYINGRFDVHQRVYAITQFSQETSGKYIYFYLVKNFGSHALQNSVKATVDSLRLPTFLDFEILIPPTYKEQTAIAAILSDMDAEIAALETKLAKTRQLKQGMMYNLLTGKIRLVSPTANITVVPEQRDSVRTATSSHNWQINEAVIIAVLAKHFGSEQYPLARKRSTKLTYLLHRHVERKAEGYLKKAAGPYNPATRYKGPEAIAQKNGYVRAHHNGTYQGFVAAANIGQAEDYFQEWYGQETLAWLEQFRPKKTDELELLTTVDMAMEDLHREGKAIQVGTVKQVIHDHPEWIAKLRRELFSDINIARAMQTCRKSFA
jgi:type I restriction enzyme, S subunit